MRSLALTVLSFVLSSSLTSAAAPKDDFESAPQGTLYGDKDLSRTTMRCHYVDNNEAEAYTKTDKIGCQFIQLLFDIPKEDSAKSVAEAGSKFESDWKDGTAKGNLISIAEVQKGCAPKTRKELESEKQKLDAERQRYKKNDYAVLLLPNFEKLNEFGKQYGEQTCACKDLKCLHDAFKSSLAMVGAGECSVTAYTWVTEFVRQGKLWSSVENSSSTCFQSVTTTLFPDTTSSTNPGWKMRTVRVPKADAPASTCGMTTVQDDSDSSTGYPPITLLCKTMRL